MTNLWKQNATRTPEPLPAGRYLVGDPCYAISHDAPQGDMWAEWLRLAWEDVDANLVTILDAEVLGHRAAASGTKYGDGTYSDQHDREYPVDAGLIGAVPVELARLMHPRHERLDDASLAAELGLQLEDFPRPFHVEYDEDGVIRVGRLSIDTGDEGGDEY